MKFGFLFLLCLFCTNASALYGEKVVSSRAQYVAELSAGKFKCAGVLISPTKLITAGHCIDVMGGEAYGYSHALVYQPHLLTVKIATKVLRASRVTIAPTYFDGLGLETEDLALVELPSAVSVTPITIASQVDLVKDTPVTLIAHQKEVQSSLISKTLYPETTVLWLHKGAGACRGDSGGAVIIKKNGEPKLAGILMFDGEGECPRKTGYSYYPKAQF